MQLSSFLLGVTLLTAVSSPALRAADFSTAQGRVDFAKQLQPLFAERCYDCHGEKKTEAGFRADNRADLLKGGDHGPAILPGKSAKSILIQVLTDTHDEIPQMPRKKEKFTDAQIDLVRKWIDQGAEWAEGAQTGYVANSNHWAFKSPTRPPVPDIKNKRWARNAVDQFILTRLEKENLTPSAEADRITLLRRLSLDLIGLPPTPQEVDAFLADNSPDAYEKQVERLLASPHYGEKWARHWLDAARYADSDGFEKDKTRNVWFYRDWVVNALNRDLPYDQFIVEQLAGDQLPDATQDQIVATGFLRNSMLNEEGGIDPEQFRMEAMFDRIDAIGKSVLGLTIQCAQCHNHKFDPISQEEYYRLFAFLNNDHEPQRVVYTVEERMRVANLSREMKDLEAGLRHTTPDWEARMAKWEETVKSNQPEWTALRPWVEDITTGGQRYLLQPDGSLLAQGYAPTKHGVHLWATNDSQNISAFQFELLTDPNLPANGPGRSFKGTGALTEFTVEAISVANPTNKFMVKFSEVTADYEQTETPLESNFDDKSNKKRVVGPVKFANDNNEDTAWGIDAGPGRRNQDRKAVFQCATNVGFAGGTIWHIRVIQRHGGWNSDDHMNNNLGRFRISVASNDAPLVADPVPKRVRDILAIPREQRSPAQTAAVFSHWRTTVPEFKDANEKIEKLWLQWPEGSTALTLQARTEPRETYLLKRGDFLKPGKAVGSGTPAILHPLPPNANGSRLTLAKWLVDEKSPTTARACVNRVWQAYFGTGLVESPEDFGTRCEPPSHPELLDWLACEFMQPTSAPEKTLTPALSLSERERGNASSAREKPGDSRLHADSRQPLPLPRGAGEGPGEEDATTSSWSIKHLHRLIVTSATYRQTSHFTPESYTRDPYNRLLARAPRLRVEGEIVRDIALAASGLLNPALGGRSVFPPAPDFLFKPPASYGPKMWIEDTGEERHRRGLYVFRWRSVPYPMLQTFDAPNGDFSCVRRLRSNTPLQALVALNEPTFMECAQALARMTLSEGGQSDAERIAFAFRRALSRSPTQGERQELLSLLEKQKKHIAEGWVNPYELATGKNQLPELPQGTTPVQLAAYTVVSRVLLNLDETITKE